MIPSTGDSVSLSRVLTQVLGCSTFPAI
jgi:hypothetical protein